jgi:hypothetical protein
MTSLRTLAVLQAGGAWSWANFYWAFVMLPVLDVLIGVCTANKSKAEYRELGSRRAFRIATCSFPVVQIATLLWAAHYVSTHTLSAWEFIGFGISIGVYTGGQYK